MMGGDGMDPWGMHRKSQNVATTIGQGEGGARVGGEKTAGTASRDANTVVLIGH